MPDQHRRCGQGLSRDHHVQRFPIGSPVRSRAWRSDVIFRGCRIPSQNLDPQQEFLHRRFESRMSRFARQRRTSTPPQQSPRSQLLPWVYVRVSGARAKLCPGLRSWPCRQKSFRFCGGGSRSQDGIRGAVRCDASVLLDPGGPPPQGPVVFARPIPTLHPLTALPASLYSHRDPNSRTVN